MRSLVALGILLMPALGLALSSTKHSCQIFIHFEKVNGENQDINFASPLKTKEQCRTLAKIHRKNFDPQKIRLKRVSYLWKKTQKNIPMIARAKPKSHHLKKHRASKSRKL